jgi:hypothetical protein
MIRLRAIVAFFLRRLANWIEPHPLITVQFSYKDKEQIRQVFLNEYQRHSERMNARKEPII